MVTPSKLTAAPLPSSSQSHILMTPGRHEIGGLGMFAPPASRLQSGKLTFLAPEQSLPQPASNNSNNSANQSVGAGAALPPRSPQRAQSSPSKRERDANKRMQPVLLTVDDEEPSSQSTLNTNSP